MRAVIMIPSGIIALLLSALDPRAVGAQEQQVKPPPDEFRALVKVIEQAYRAPLEADKNIIDELRQQYRDPKPEREERIIREVRRAYTVTTAQEEAIRRAVRRACQEPSAEHEERVFEEIGRAEAIPPGTISTEAQVERAAKMFRKLDRNGDGILSSDELPEVLRSQLREWDKNRDGAINAAEYQAYFQASLKWVADRVAAGEIPIKLPKPAAAASSPEPPPKSPGPPAAAPARPAASQPALPDWFAQLDEDGDGQVGLYEWKKAGRPIAEFLEMDRNHDGFLEAKELLAYLADHPPPAPADRKRR